MSHSTADDHGAKDPAITGTSQKIWGVFAVIFGVTCALILLWWFIDAKQNPKQENTRATAPAALPVTEEIIVAELRKECYVTRSDPCYADIAWDYRIAKPSGRPVAIKFGDLPWKVYESDERGPSNFQGRVHFKLPDSDSLPMRIRVSEKVKKQVLVKN